MIKQLLFLFIISFTLKVEAAGLMQAIDVSAAGMKAQAKRLSVISQNIANADATGITSGAKPYQRKTVYFKVKKDRERGIDIITVDKVGRDNSDFQVKFNPSHPAANDQGYVLYPNIDRVLETMDAKEAQRSYEANMKALEITKSMINKTIDILK